MKKYCDFCKKEIELIKGMSVSFKNRKHCSIECRNLFYLFNRKLKGKFTVKKVYGVETKFYYLANLGYYTEQELFEHYINKKTRGK